MAARVAVMTAVLSAAQLTGSCAAAESARTLPPPAVDPQATATSEVAVLAGGCFWGVQGVFQHVKGVKSAISGYAGGTKETAEYDIVASGTTAHAESVQITFDPRVVTYGHLLQIFFSVAHDPTELDRQGPDRGTQYRSAIFPTPSAQAAIAKAYIAQLDQAHVFDRPIVTKVEADRSFYPAESYHQDYLVRHPMQAYIAINDLPKLENLRHLFPDAYQAWPVLVGSR